MSQDQERIKAMVALKQRLEKRLTKLDAETKELQATLDAVNGILLEKGFKRASEAQPKEAPKEADVAPKPEATVPKESKPTGYQGGEP
jgi:hypothetical protein